MWGAEEFSQVVVTTLKASDKSLTGQFLSFLDSAFATHTISPGVALWHFINRTTASALCSYVFLSHWHKSKYLLTTCHVAKLKDLCDLWKQTEQSNDMRKPHTMCRTAVWRSGDLGSLFSLWHWLKTVDLKQFTHFFSFASISFFRWGSKVYLIWQKAQLNSGRAISSCHVLRLTLLLKTKTHKVAPHSKGYYVYQHS